MAHIRILVVEDGIEVLKFYRTIFEGNFKPFLQTLAENQIDVTYAENFLDARVLSKEQFDAVFLDHNLPLTKGNTCTNIGYELIPAFRAANKNVIIIGTSSLRNINAPYDIKFDKSGLNSYEELCRIVTEILRRK